MKHRFQNPIIKQIVRHLVEMDRSEFQSVDDFMEDLGVVLDQESHERLLDEAMRLSAKTAAPVRAGPKFRADILDKVARGALHCDA